MSLNGASALHCTCGMVRPGAVPGTHGHELICEGSEYGEKKFHAWLWGDRDRVKGSWELRTWSEIWPLSPSTAPAGDSAPARAFPDLS